MATKDIKEFDRTIGRKLSGYTEQPPVDFFARIEKSMEEAKAPVVVPAINKVRRHVYRYAAAAAILVSVVLTATLFRNTRPLEATAEHGDVSGQLDRGVPVVTDGTAASDGIMETIAANDIQNEPDGSAQIQEQIVKSYGVDAAFRSDAPISDELNTDEESVPSTDDIQYTPARRKGRVVADDPESKRRMEIDRAIQIENYWGDLFQRVDSESSGAGGRNTPVTSLYAGNFGTGVGVVDDPIRLAAGNMLIKEESNSIPSSVISGGSGRSGKPMTADASDAPEESGVTLRHMMPVNAGISLMFPVSGSVSIVSGLNYSYLYSSTRQQLLSTGGEGSVKQELHYVGIPVGVMYSFYDNRIVDFYLRGGVAVEKAVYARRTVDRDLGGEPEVSKMGVKGMQFSVDGAIGANFRLTRRVGLYLEPGVAYYFEGGNESANFGTFSSYRTDNPVNFTLRLGVRFNI